MAKDLTQAFDLRHKACLEAIAEDADEAYEEAMIWRGDGGGRRARHCEAMALFALGHKTEAAHRLDQLAGAPDGGSKAMRANYYNEAANFWLMADKAAEAYDSASQGLQLQDQHVELRIARARAYALMGRYHDAETDLTSVLVYEPDHAAALRYRADARRQQGRLIDARHDIEASLDLDATSVETALLRGQIIEAIRQSNEEAAAASPSEQTPNQGD